MTNRNFQQKQGIRAWIGEQIFNLKYRLGIAREGRDFITVGQELPPEDHRCCICQNKEECPAFDSGVLFPCPHFKLKEDNHAEE